MKSLIPRFRRTSAPQPIVDPRAEIHQIDELLRSPDEFCQWLAENPDKVEDRAIVHLVQAFLASRGHYIKVWVSTWPPYQLSNDEAGTLGQAWIVNLQLVLGQFLAKPMRADEVLEVVKCCHTTSLVPLPPGYGDEEFERAKQAHLKVLQEHFT